MSLLTKYECRNQHNSDWDSNHGVLYSLQDKKCCFASIATHNVKSKFHVDYDDDETKFVDLLMKIWDTRTEKKDTTIASDILAVTRVVKRYGVQNESYEPVFELTIVLDKKILLNLKCYNLKR